MSLVIMISSDIDNLPAQSMLYWKFRLYLRFTNKASKKQEFAPARQVVHCLLLVGKKICAIVVESIRGKVLISDWLYWKKMLLSFGNIKISPIRPIFLPKHIKLFVAHCPS